MGGAWCEGLREHPNTHHATTAFGLVSRELCVLFTGPRIIRGEVSQAYKNTVDILTLTEPRALAPPARPRQRR